MFELVEKKCPKCGLNSLVLALLADAKKVGQIEDVFEVSIYCTNGFCTYDKIIAKRNENLITSRIV
ncbi:MAG TPA: hypothetical protein VGB37_00900 [Candidatus Lokiarchaeia archaeon]